VVGSEAGARLTRDTNGRTSADGTTVEERPTSAPDLLATVCAALGVDPLKQNRSSDDRPIRIVDKAACPIIEIVDP
jgi:hypothetical protein